MEDLRYYPNDLAPDVWLGLLYNALLWGGFIYVMYHSYEIQMGDKLLIVIGVAVALFFFTSRTFRRPYVVAFCIATLGLGGGADVERHIQETGEFLLRQIRVVSPDLVLCCGDVIFQGVHELLKRSGPHIFEFKQTSGGLEYIMWADIQTVFIRYHHPNAYYPRAMSYSYLMKEIHKILS